MSTDQYILITEQNWLKTLYDFNQNLFSNTHIPSHDHTHHVRVWCIAKDIIRSLKQEDISYNLVEAVLIAAMLHDTGLTKTLDERHGLESRRICENYFRLKTKPPLFHEILEAVEFHDDKNYKSQEQVSLLSKILYTSDDLDAFGHIGVFRYAEIYAMREIDKTDLPKRVLINLEKRFRFFTRTFNENTAILAQHNPRYQTIHDFYTNALQASSNEQNILDILYTEFSSNTSIQENDNYVVSLATKYKSHHCFFHNLIIELEKFNSCI